MRVHMALLIIVGLVGCKGFFKTIERASDRPQAIRSTPKFTGEIPNMLRGTIKQHVALMGYTATYSESYEPMVASGYGLVVGLNHTGSNDIPPQVRAHMIADLAKRGFGESTHGWGDLSPEELLNSDETAVVIVEAVIPQAATGRKPRRASMDPNHPSLQGTTFDIRIHAEPSSGTKSLEGGYLLPTLLRLGQLKTGKSQAREVASAEGAIFINPFASPGSIGKDSIQRTSGRILEGGEALLNMPMRLVLLEKSHTRATMIQTAINRAFPEERGQDGPTAHGMNAEQIEIRVPPSWKNDVRVFMNMMTHITMRQQNPESVALSIKRLLLSDPSPRNADAATWRWRAIGDRSLVIIRDLYDYPDELPRLAALRAGGGLGDPISVPHLLTMATSQIGLGNRLDAIDLLQEMGHDPRIEYGLRPLLNDNDLEIRLRTAEALLKRNDPLIKRYAIGHKFELVLVPSEHKMIYVTQAGVPKIILTGDIEIQRPLTLQAWDNTLLVKEVGDDPSLLEVLYRNPETGTTFRERVTTDLPAFVVFLSHQTTPESPSPGLNLTYSRTIGALHELWRQQYLAADFKVEQDRLLATIQRLTTEYTYTARPEFPTVVVDEEEDRFLESPPTTTLEDASQ